jgi:hypothetical protein
MSFRVTCNWSKIRIKRLTYTFTVLSVWHYNYHFNKPLSGLFVEYIFIKCVVLKRPRKMLLFLFLWSSFLSLFCYSFLNVILYIKFFWPEVLLMWYSILHVSENTILYILFLKRKNNFRFSFLGVICNLHALKAFILTFKYIKN